MPSFVSFIPTPLEHIGPFFDMAPVSLSDVVYDLGSGDGRLLFAALEKGAGKAVGVELDSECIRRARETALSRGLEGRVTFVEADFLDVSLSDASLVLCYLFPSAFLFLESKFETELRTGTRLVMETFPMPGWKPVQVMKTGGKHFYLYVMPPEKGEYGRELSWFFDSWNPWCPNNLPQIV